VEGSLGSGILKIGGGKRRPLKKKPQKEERKGYYYWQKGGDTRSAFASFFYFGWTQTLEISNTKDWAGGREFAFSWGENSMIMDHPRRGGKSVWHRGNVFGDPGRG